MRGPSLAQIARCTWLGCLAGCVSEEPSLDLAGGAFAPRLGGGLELESSGGGGSTEADLGLDDTAFVPYFQARGGWRAFHGEVSGFNADFGGSATTTSSLGSIPAGTPVDSDFRTSLWKATVTGNLADLGPVRLAAGLGVVRLDLDLSVHASASGLTEKRSASANVPVLVADARLPLDPFRVRASLAGITGDFGDSSGTFLDAELRAGFEFLPGRELFAGYRYVHDTLSGVSKGNDFDFEMHLHGVLFGLEVRF